MKPELNSDNALGGHRAVRALGLAGALLPNLLPAQTRVTVHDPCISCIIREHVVRLGETEGPGIIESEITTVVRDAHGRFLAVNPVAPHSITVFAPDGTFIKRVGRRGRGPGEYQFLYRMLLPLSPDTVVAFDQALSRLTFLNRDMEVISTSRVDAHPLSFVDLTALDGPPRQMILSGAFRTGERIGLPLHRLRVTGEIEGSFGSPPEELRSENPDFNTRLVVAADDSSVWTVWRDRVRLEKWTVQGELLRVLQRDVVWFDDAPRGENDEPDPKAPHPHVSDIEIDLEGRIWIMYSVPDDNWEDVVGTGGPHGFSVEDYAGYWDTVVDVIDPDASRLIATQRFDWNSFYFLSPIEIGVTHFVEDEPYLDIYGLRVEVAR